MIAAAAIAAIAFLTAAMLAAVGGGGRGLSAMDRAGVEARGAAA
jgi:hypothetical protein